MQRLWKYIKTWLIVTRKRILRLLDPSKNEDYVKFAIVCAPRSGSTMLHTYLNSHPAILSHGEIIRREIEKGREIISVDELVFSPQSKRIKALGIKVFYEFKEKDGYRQAYEEIVENSKIKIIHLIRNDVGKQLLSLKKAEESGAWSSTLKSESEINVSVTDDEIDRFKKEINRKINQAKTDFADHEVMEVTYEDLVTDPKNILNRIQLFLKVEPRQLFTLLQKQG